MGGGVRGKGIGKTNQKERGAGCMYMGGPERGINPLLEGENM